MNYYEFLEGPAGRALHMLPFPAVRNALAWSGQRGFLRDCDFLPEVLCATQVADEKAAPKLSAEIHANQARVYADLGLLMHGKRAPIEKYITSRITVKNRDVIENLKGKPFLIVSAHFASFYIASLVPGLFDPVSVIRRFHSKGRDDLIEKLKRLTGHDLEVLGLTDPKIGLQILSRIKQKRPVAAMVDFFYEDTSLILAPFMGQDSATPAGLPMIAVKLGIPVLPVIVVREGDGYCVNIDLPLEPEQSGDVTRDAFNLTCRINAWLEKQVRAYPEQWTFWSSLPRRWAYGAQAEGAEPYDA